LAGAVTADAFFAGAAFVVAFFAGAFAAAVLFAAGVFFAAEPDPSAGVAGDRRDTTLRAAEAALPANDRLVVRAMGSLPGVRRGAELGPCGGDAAVTVPSEGIAPDRHTQSRHA
jgi:hypothetical protein